jgi:hypothetical protein
MGSLLGRLLPEHKRTKEAHLLEEDESVSTDILFARMDKSKTLVIPAKITTRERIVQVFAHQRILDSVHGAGNYVSILVSASETQRDGKKNRANMICVPGTIKLFQKHLAAIGGMYYIDPPGRYLAADMTAILPVNTIGYLLTKELPNIA